MDKKELQAFWNDDEIFNNFLTAILKTKLDALNNGRCGLSYGEKPDLFRNIADNFFSEYFDRFTDVDYESIKPYMINKKGV